MFNKEFRFLVVNIPTLIATMCLFNGCAGYPGNNVQTSSDVIIIGQNGWFSNSANRGKSSASANSLNEPWDLSLDTTNSTIYVADTKNNRVLRWNTLIPTSNANASLVLGQINFMSNQANQGGSADADTFSSPKGVHVVTGTTPRLAVADTNNNRVLVWTALPTSNGQNANIVLGQDDDDMDGNFFNETLPNQGADKPLQNSLNKPTGVFVDITNARIIVADSGNNRVLVWNSLTPANGANANLVIGQVITPDGGDDPFTYNFVNQNNTDTDEDDIPDPDSSSLYNPTSVFLITAPFFFINDQNNYRTLIYNVWPLVANADGSTSSVATACIGQTAFNKRIKNQQPGDESGNPSTSNLNLPHDVFSDGTRVWVTDTGNNRILRYDSIPTACNAPTGAVIGQLSTFTGTPGVGPNRFNSPRGIFEIAAGGSRFLWIADSLNHRVIRIVDN